MRDRELIPSEIIPLPFQIFLIHREIISGKQVLCVLGAVSLWLFIHSLYDNWLGNVSSVCKTLSSNEN